MSSAYHFDPASIVLLGSLFLILLAAMRHFTQKTPLPYEAWMMLAGFAYAKAQPHVSMLPQVEFEPEVIMLMILPLLIFAEGRLVHVKSLLNVIGSVSYLALFGVIFSTAIIGLALAWMMGIPPVHGLLLGAALAATDPSAVGVVLSKFSIPEKLLMSIEGESLFNDGVAIVLFTTLAAIAIHGEQLSLGSAALNMLWVVLAAAPLGWLAGWATAKVIVAWSERNEFTGITLTIVLAYCTFLLAEHLLHVSGIIAVLFASLAFVRGRYPHEAKHDDNDAFQSMWSYLGTLAGSLVFFMLGDAVGEHPFVLSWVIPGVVLVVLLSRAMLIYGGASLVPQVRRWTPGFRHVLMMGGLRGAISAALVLSIPADYLYRQEFLCLVFVVIIVTLFFQPPILKSYLNRQPISESEG